MSLDIDRPTLWRFGHMLDRPIQLVEKPCGGGIAALGIPGRCGECLFHRSGMKSDLSLRHHPSAIRRRASVQGTVATAFWFSSLSRRSTSALQANSACSSTSSSRLSMSEPASAARPSGGSASARLRSSDASCLTSIFYISRLFHSYQTGGCLQSECPPRRTITSGPSNSSSSGDCGYGWPL